MAEEDKVILGYSDSLEVVSTPYGVCMNFGLSPPKAGKEQTRVAEIRMSFEMAKVQTCILLRFIRKIEKETGVSYPISTDILNNMKIPREDWDALWAPSTFKLEGE